ncbi:MAG TPA: SAM-dependent methyltransferase, partial [Polyangiaceae bacterium]|nr:SAM-dependent methyltransferase [Polyangiaceae bacterium]
MTGRPSDRDGGPNPFASSSFEERLAASSLMSCRWTQDNLVTSYPALLYNGAIERPIGVESLEPLLLELAKLRPVRGVGAGHMGVFTWDIACEGDTGEFMLQLPLVLDAPGVRGRSKRDVPRQNHTNLRAFREQGLTRFGVEPEAFTLLGGLVPAATFAALPDHHALTFERGSLQVEVVEAERSWVVPLGPALTAELLAEMVAILVYHYDSSLDGGTAITDVFVNDGDFVVKRRTDGTFDLRLTAARQRESGIGPDLLLLYLIQMMAYEDWEVGDDLVGLPVLISNPSVAFEGLVRGLRYRCLDQGVPEHEGRREAFGWIEQFGHSLQGRSYRPWVDRFLAGQLPLGFGHDPREHWWRLAPLDTKLGLLELTARKYPDSAATASAKVMRELVERLACEIGCVPAARNEIRVNDQSPDELITLLAEARIPRAAQAAVLESILTHWPYKNLEHLLARVPSAGRLRRMKSRLAFGHVVSQAIEGTVKSLPARNESRRPSRILANPELFGELSLPPSLYPEAIQTFSTFEGYMDQSLHDVHWGYYARHVVIGSQGHFATHPESYSPDYGRWIARLAFKAWRDMLAHGELAETDAFPIVEFGAGNGRLARDVLDAIAAAAHSEHAADPGWHSFLARARYHVYEMSESLRAKQRQLLGAAACVAEGDARRPQATLARDFPGGLRGFLVTNEVPDAFGVHKVVLTADGQAFAALVVPRVERQA